MFNVTALLKHDKVSRKKEPIIFYAYPHNVQLCSVHIINRYRRVRDALVPSTEKAFFVVGVPLHNILTSGQWATVSTFYKFYQRQIIWSDVTDNKEFADSILANRRYRTCMCTYISLYIYSIYPQHLFLLSHN